MITPTIHMNGTSKDHLMEALLNARQAMRQAMIELEATAPNARDYYPQGKDAFKTAVDEHVARLESLNTVDQQLYDLAMAIVDQ